MVVLPSPLVRSLSAPLSALQLRLPTATLYRRSSSTAGTSAGGPLHVGEFAKEREVLDYTFHAVPSIQRQAVQDDIIRKVLTRVVKECRECSEGDEFLGCSREVDEATTINARPLALFTAGGMGAGKGHTLRYLLRKGIIRLPHNFIWVDPDSIACSLPERAQYLASDPSTASTLLHAEASLIQEILMGVARRKGQERTLVIDGSLSNCTWYSSLMEEFSSAGFDLEILFVYASEETMLERAKKRALKTGRVTDPASIKRSRLKSPKCVTTLARKEHVGRVRLFDNSETDTPPRLAYDSQLDPNWSKGAHIDVEGYVEGRLGKETDELEKSKILPSVHAEGKL